MFFNQKALFFAFAISLLNSTAQTADHVAMPTEIATPAQAPMPAELQSPIRIEKAMKRDLPDIKFNYPESLRFDLEFNGHTIQANVSDNGTTGNEQEASIELNGKEYELKQFHVHAPSEHIAEDKRYPLEWHFVHQADDGTRLVIGVFMDDGKETTVAYNRIINNLKHSLKTADMHDNGNRSFGNCVLNPRALIPADQRCWRYDGSLTTPPYTAVYWCVVRAITTINREDLDTLFQAMHINTRGLQDLKGRNVVFDTTLDTITKAKPAPTRRAYRSRRARTKQASRSNTPHSSR